MLTLIAFCHIMKIYESNTFLSVIRFLVPHGDAEIPSASKANTVSYLLSVGKVLIVALGYS